MNKTLLLSACWLLCQGVSAQPGNPLTPDTNIRTITLNEVVVKTKEPGKLGNKTRSGGLGIMINPEAAKNVLRPYNIDFTYCMTKFVQPEEVPVSLLSVTTRLRKFDTTIFDVDLLVFQIQGRDTLTQLIRINERDIDKKNHLKILLFDEQIILQPGRFMIGYGIHVKRVSAPFIYRLYGTDKTEGAMVFLNPEGGISIREEDVFYPPPFIISYSKH